MLLRLLFDVMKPCKRALRTLARFVADGGVIHVSSSEATVSGNLTLEGNSAKEGGNRQISEFMC